MKKFILLGLAGITGLLCCFGTARPRRETDTSRQIARLSERAMALYSHGQFDRAKADFLAVRVSLSQIVGPRDPATLGSRNNHAAVLFAMGDFAGAEAEHRSTMNLRDKTLGRLNPDAIASRQNLAVTLMCAGKYEEALLHQRCVESVRRHLFGENDPKSRQARRLIMLIEDAMKSGKPGSAPSGFGSSAVLPA